MLFLRIVIKADADNRCSLSEGRQLICQGAGMQHRS